MIYTIGEMAKQLGIAPSALRYYDKEGLLPFIERSEGGTRIFRDRDYELLKIIHCLKESGMKLKDIRIFISLVLEGDASIDKRLALFKKQKLSIEKQIEALKQTLDTVKYKCWYYEAAKKAGTTQVPENMRDDELPEDMRKIRQRLKKAP